MRIQTLTSTTVLLMALAFLALDVLTGNKLFWVLGISSFMLLSCKLIGIESKYYRHQDYTTKGYSHE